MSSCDTHVGTADAAAIAYLLGQPCVAVNLEVVTLVINDFGSLSCIPVIPNQSVLEGHSISFLCLLLILCTARSCSRCLGYCLGGLRGLSRGRWGWDGGGGRLIRLAVLTVG